MPVLAYHVVFGAYGFWLPNDPRGSNSAAVWAPHLQDFGPATKVLDRRSHASDPHDRQQRLAAKRALKRPAVRFSGVQARAVGRGFDGCVDRTRAMIHACCILPDHVHLVVARHRYSIERLVAFLKGDATRELLAQGLHPFQTHDGPSPSPWGAACRKVFLNSDSEIRSRIEYVRQNPLRQGKKEQRWSFVVPYE